MNAKQKQAHIMYGLHSNIPACCVHYFVEEWMFNGRRKYDGSSHANNLTRAENKVGHIGYVPCPVCLTNENFVQVHMCDASCQKVIDEFYRWRDHKGE